MIQKAKKEFNMKSESKNILLNGLWNYVTDPEEKYLYNQVEELINQNSKNKITVPSNWECEGFHNFNGSIWFATKFDLQNDLTKDDISVLLFKGVDYFAEVWLNGKNLGRHEGYFQKFVFNVSKELKVGSNLLVVKVTSPKEIPGEVWP